MTEGRVGLNRQPAIYQNGEVVRGSGHDHNNGITHRDAVQLIIFMFGVRELITTKVVSFDRNGIGIFYPFYLEVKDGEVVDRRDVPGFTGGYIHRFIPHESIGLKNIYELVASYVNTFPEFGAEWANHLVADYLNTKQLKAA